MARHCDGITKFGSIDAVGAFAETVALLRNAFAAAGITAPLTLVRMAAPDPGGSVAGVNRPALVDWMSIALVSTPVFEKLFDT